MWSRSPYTFDKVVRIFFSVAVFIIVLFFVYVLRDVLLPFCVACLAAYIIEPWVKWNQRILKIRSHRWAVVLTTIEGLILFGAFVAILVPIISNEISQLSVLLSCYVKYDNPELSQLPDVIHDFIHTHFDMDKIISSIDKINITEAIDGIWRSVTSGLDKILGILGRLICLVYVIFILLDFDKYKKNFEKYIPERYKPAVSVLSYDVSWTMKKYFRNQAFISFIVGILYAIGFSIVGIPMAVAIGLINMLLFMVPYLVYVSLIPVTIMCAFHSMDTGMNFWTVWFECVAVYAVVEVLADIVITPHIMGKALGMNPAIILLSISIWGSLLGILGMFISLPATTILIKWGKMWLTNWRDRENEKEVSGPPGDT